MPTQFTPLKGKSPIEFLGAIPTPLSIGGDMEEIIQLLKTLPEEYKTWLLETNFPKISRMGGRGIRQRLQADVSKAGVGAPGMEMRPFEFSTGKGKDFTFRGQEGQPLGQTSIFDNIVLSLATEPSASPIQRAKALMELGKTILKEQGLPGELTHEGAKLLEKIKQLAKQIK